MSHDPFQRVDLEPPPPLRPQFFYASPIAIDDPLSPVPPPVSGSFTAQKLVPRPFSEFDNSTLENGWYKLKAKDKDVHAVQLPEEGPQILSVEQLIDRPRPGSSSGEEEDEDRPLHLPMVDGEAIMPSLPSPTTTGNPFVRAPSRKKVVQVKVRRDDDPEAMTQPPSKDVGRAKTGGPREVGKRERKSVIPVGVSRLHSVDLSKLRMEPIYWPPLVQDVAHVVRGTWFYTDSFLPVETDVANLLEAGYTTMQPWTDTWKDELASALEVGAEGEVKILHRLWPEYVLQKPGTRPTSPNPSGPTSGPITESMTTEERRRHAVESASKAIDDANIAQNSDRKAYGNNFHGRDGRVRTYLDAGVLYANTDEAYILRPNLQPSSYYGRRPLASYIRKGHSIGIKVTRGFQPAAWAKNHPNSQHAESVLAHRGAASAAGGIPPSQRRKADGNLALSKSPIVTDLILVIHGIGQKLSERVESYHFTYSINALRREFNVNVGAESVRQHFRDDMGGVMVLPVNWRHGLTFEEGGYRSSDTEDAYPTFELQDITPESLPSVRGIVSDVMLDIPYYMSQHKGHMTGAMVKEANRIYHLWCQNNPGFHEYGRVHVIAHSLGSVMAIDVLSQQPSQVQQKVPAASDEDISRETFAFNTRSLFLVGSPVGLFFLLRKATLRPRHGRTKPGADLASVGNEQVGAAAHTFGCIAVDNVYNIVNPYDPVAYRLNATMDPHYAAALKPAWIPSAASTWGPLSIFSSSQSYAQPQVNGSAKAASSARLPPSVEMEIHNFTREELAEQRAFLLNDNAQIDYHLRYGGGPLEIQYLTMLSAHSSYWLSRDFVRFVAIEIGRQPGRAFTLPVLRAAKKKKALP